MIQLWTLFTVVVIERFEIVEIHADIVLIMANSIWLVRLTSGDVVAGHSNVGSQAYVQFSSIPRIV